MHNVQLIFKDGAERTVHVPNGGVLLDAALESHIQIIHQCKTGSCSTCACTVIAGDLRLEASTSISLFPREIAVGERLACLTHVYSDGVVRFPYDSTELNQKSVHRFQTVIRSIEYLNDSVVKVVLCGLKDMPEFASGMYFLISVPGTEAQRAYSPMSCITDYPEMEFLIRLRPGGVMSSYLADRAVPGNLLELEGPYGEFKWNKTTYPIIMMAGGTGIAPLISILKTIAAERRHKERIILCFGVNRKEDLFFEEELEYYREIMPRLDVRIAVVESHPEWGGLTGHVSNLLRDSDVKPNSQAFLCGPPPMVSAARERLLSLGVQPDAIMYERFSAT